MAQNITKIAIKITLIILAIAAIWYAFKILTFSTLPESESETWLGVSEALLIVSAILLTLGLLGEWPDSDSWKKRFIYKVAKACVIIGVVGELLGDAGIFETSRRLQGLQDKAVIVATDRATDAGFDAALANKLAGEATERAAQLEKDAANARASVAEANATAAKAIENAANANARAAQLEKDAANVRLEQERLKQAVSWHLFTQEEADKLIAALKSVPLTVTNSVEIVSIAGDAQSDLLGKQLATIFRTALWTVWLSSMSFDSPPGIQISEPPNETTSAIRDAFRAANIPFGTFHPARWVGFSGIPMHATKPPTQIFVGPRPPPPF
jgi:hypothetical protein